MAQLLPLKGSVLRIFITVFVQLSYLYSGKKRSYSHQYKMEGLSFFVYYRCAQHRNLYQRGDVCVIGFSSLLFVDWAPVKLNLDPIPGVKGSAVHACCCTRAVRAGYCCAAREPGPWGGWAARPRVPCSAQAAAAEDLTCSLSGVLFCCSDNSIVKGPNLFLPCTLCSSILPPLLFPESLIWEYRKCFKIKQDAMKCCLFILWLVSLFFPLTSSLGFGEQVNVPRHIGVSGDCCRDLRFPVGYAEYWASLSGQQEAFFLP